MMNERIYVMLWARLRNFIGEVNELQAWCGEHILMNFKTLIRAPLRKQRASFVRVHEALSTAPSTCLQNPTFRPIALGIRSLAVGGPPLPPKSSKLFGYIYSHSWTNLCSYICTAKFETYS